MPATRQWPRRMLDNTPHSFNLIVMKSQIFLPVSATIIALVAPGMALFAQDTSLSRPAASSSETIAITKPENLTWQDYPGLPGVKFVVIAGNPKEAGLYTIRAKFAPGTMSRPHWHPETRYVTVLQGTWWAGEGAKLDPDATIPLPAGSFAVHAAKAVHFDGAKEEEVIVQISGMGPSGTIVVDPPKE